MSQSSERATFHGVQYERVIHEPYMASLSGVGSFIYTNKSGSKQYIQRFTLIPTGGSPVILVKVGGKYWTRLQQGTPTGISDSPFNLTLSATFDFMAFNENQEIEIDPQQQIEVDVVSGTAGVIIAFVLAQGENKIEQQQQ
jgi:hypothetical protein